MGLRFRKSINIGPLRINASKTGIGYSIGTKGLRYTKCANGRKRTTASLYGTGISYVEEHGNKKNDKIKEKKHSFILNMFLLPFKIMYWMLIIPFLAFIFFIDFMNKICK